MTKDNFWLRYIETKDDKDRLIEITEVKSTNSPVVADELIRESTKNKKIHDQEEEEKKAEEEKKQEALNYLAKYSLKKLIIAINYGYQRGFIPSDFRTAFNEDVDKIMETSDTTERANLIKALIENENYATFGEFFNLLED